jgi:hypothetical protein
MVLIVRHLDSEDFERIIEARVAEWPVRSYLSLADLALRDDLNGIYRGGIGGLYLSVQRKEFCGFWVVCAGITITILESGEANGRSKSNVNNIEAQEIVDGSNRDNEAMGSEGDSDEGEDYRWSESSSS